MKNIKLIVGLFAVVIVGIILFNCSGSGESASAEDAAKRTYVKPGSYDEFYAFMSGGFNGQLSVYGLPSGRMFKNISVFSQNPETGYGYSEETKGMLMTSYGFIPWDDAHHPVLSKTNGEQDGRWIFINGNNTPRVARIDLSTFETAEIIEIPNSAGNHGSPFLTENTEYVVASTRFSLPIPNKDVPIASYKENFKGTVSFISVDNKSGDMKVAFQILVPGLNYDLAHAGKGPSHGWAFFTSYNSEQANALLEINASQNDKDFIAAVNWKKAEEYVKAGKAQKVSAEYYNNLYNEETHS
ncbi:MAG: nitrous oxide reductase, partial [Ignavibacteriales bacterium]|nr:nitrous oxide reductase [Ignavibacteriales bacterium]